MPLTDEEFGQPLKRGAHAQEQKLVQPPTWQYGMEQKRTLDLPRGSAEGKQEVLWETRNKGNTGPRDP